MAIPFYIDLLTKRAVRSPASAAPAPLPDFRNPAAYTIQVYFLRRSDTTTENYAYTRFTTGTPQLRLRRNKAPDFCTFVLDFFGYRSPVIDARLGNKAIEAIIGTIPSIGKGNVRVTGNFRDGFKIEFINGQAGYAQPMFAGQVMTPTNGEIVIKEAQSGGLGVNEIQTIQLREGALATATGWSELIAASQWGWQATLDTTNVDPNVFDKSNLVAEIGLEATGVRTGVDGVTTNEGTGRSGSDGQTIAGPTDTAVTLMPQQDADGTCYLVAKDGLTVYGRLFNQQDIGRVVQNNGIQSWIAAPDLSNSASLTRIVRVIEFEHYNAAVLDTPFSDGKLGTTPPDTAVPFNVLGGPTKIYRSASAAFTASDAGHPFASTNVPIDTTILQVIDAQNIVMSQLATKVTTGLGWTVSAVPSNLFSSVGGAFTIFDIGSRFESPAIPAGTTVIGLPAINQFALSQRALSIGTGLAWTLRPKNGGFTAPTVTSTQTGTLGQPEKQKITLVLQPIGGYLTIRDGADASLPIVKVPAPFNSMIVQSAINTDYQNFNGVSVKETVPNGEYEITFGINGQQHLLVVDDSNLVYDMRIAQIPLGQPPTTIDQEQRDQKIQIPAVLVRRGIDGLWLVGVPLNGVYNVAISRAEITNLSDGTNANQIKQRFLTTVNDYVPGNVGDTHPNFGNYRLERFDNVEDRGAMRAYDWIGYNKPSDRSEKMQQSRPVYIVPISFQGTSLIDIQIASVSVSTWVDAIYSYFIWQSGGNNGLALPSDGPFGTVIHFMTLPGFTGQNLSLFAGNNFGIPYFSNGIWHAGAGTSGGYFPQSWSRRRWHSDIWEQVVFAN
jgi:hypothetical protein